MAHIVFLPLVVNQNVSGAFAMPLTRSMAQLALSLAIDTPSSQSLHQETLGNTHPLFMYVHRCSALPVVLLT